MKLALLRDGSPAGLPVLVSRDLSRCVPVSGVAETLDALLDDWDAIAPILETVAGQLERGKVDAWRFHEAHALAPLPDDPARIQTPRGVELTAWQASRDPFVVASRTALTSRAERIGLIAGASGRPVLQVLVCLLEGDGQVRAACSPVAVASQDLSLMAIVGQPPKARLSVGDPDGPLEPAGGMPAKAASGTALSLAVGERFRLAAYDERGRSVFGAVEGWVEPPAPRMPPLKHPPVRPTA